MQTIDLVSAIVSTGVVGILALRFGLMANAMLIAEVVWSRRFARVTVPAHKARSVAVPPLALPPVR